MEHVPGWLIWTLNWAISLVMVPIVSRRHAPPASLAWLAVVFFMPIIGVLGYVLIGRTPLPRRRIRARGRAIVPLPDAVLAALEAFHGEARSDPAVAAIQQLSRGVADLPIVDGNAVSITADTSVTFARIIAEIDRAVSHVHLLFYIFEDDDTGRAVVDTLLRAAARGVTCRVLADDVGSRAMLRRQAPRLIAAGVQVHALLPVGPTRALFRRIDLRNHRKLVVIDGRVAYTGSQNVTDANNTPRRIVYHDVMVRIVGPAVAPLQQVFIEDWFFETEERLTDVVAPVEAAGSVSVQAVPSGPNYPSEAFMHLLVSMIHLARERVVLTTPYFIPNEALLVAFDTAVQRGVTVDLVVPQRSDLRLAGAATFAYAEQVMNAGVRVHLFQDGLLHTKSMVVDDQITVIGTGNLDVRSFYLNLELNLLVPDADFAAEVLAIQAGYLARSIPIDPDAWAARPRWHAWVEDLAKLFSPLL